MQEFEPYILLRKDEMRNSKVIVSSHIDGCKNILTEGNAEEIVTDLYGRNDRVAGSYGLKIEPFVAEHENKSLEWTP